MPHTARPLLAILVATGTLAACTQATADTDSPEVQALIEDTLNSMRRVEGGTFMMGDQRGPTNLYFTRGTNNKPAFQVTLDTYYMGAYEVSYAEFDLYTEIHGLEPTMNESWARDAAWRSPEHPAGVSWTGASAYCKWLAEVTDLPFALPTEAQWEFAARNRGEVIPFATNDGTIREGENFRNAVLGNTAHPSGKYPPNPLGIHDLAANMLDWVNDWYAEDYYQWGDNHNPQGPEEGDRKVLRGGSFLESPEGANVFIRQHSGNYEKNNPATGFRCVVNSESLGTP